MIAQLRGRILPLDDETVIVDTGGVGYAVNCHARAIGSFVGGADDEVVLHVHTSVSDDAIRLYGFTDAAELRLFRLLIGVERIGPKAGLAIIGRADLATLGRALREEDAALLATVPGIGRKTAERVVLELRGKVDWLVPGGVVPAAAASDAAVHALTGLGYREAEARIAVSAVKGDGNGDINSLVTAALRHLDEAGARS